MDSKQFKEYKAIIEEAIRQAELTEHYTIHPQIQDDPDDPVIFITTNRSRECILITNGSEIHVLKRDPHSPAGTITFKTHAIIDLAEPGSILQLGVAIKDLLNFSYWSKSDELG